MRLVYIHGLPAAGKSTVARALKAFLPEAGLLENTMAIDFARNVMDMYESGFWPLVFSIREQALDMAAMAANPDLIIIATACFTDPRDLEWLVRYEAHLERFNSKLLPVHLTCSMDELERRVGNPDRVERDKLCTVDGLRVFASSGSIVPVPRDNLLTIDTEKVLPTAAAQTIFDHFELGLH